MTSDRPFRPCTFPGCGRPIKGTGLCAAHWSQRKRGDELYPVGDPAVGNAKRLAAWARLTPEERARRLAPAVANLGKRGTSWRKANAEAQRRAWAEGRAAPKGQRTCPVCGNDFAPHSGPQVYCSRACLNLNRRAMGHGITVQQLQAIDRRQGSACAICQRKTVLHVDHDHTSGTVRGLLCQTCNTGLGKLGDDVAALRRAIAYLEERADDP